jgi:hypothetical protein
MKTLLIKIFPDFMATRRLRQSEDRADFHGTARASHDTEHPSRCTVGEQSTMQSEAFAAQAAVPKPRMAKSTETSNAVLEFLQSRLKRRI